MSVFETHYLARPPPAPRLPAEPPETIAPASMEPGGLGDGGTDILYAEDFDAAAPPEPAPPPAHPAPPALTQADLARARAEGHAQGLQDAAARESSRHAVLTQSAIQSACDALQRAEHAIIRQAEATATALVKTMISLSHTMLETEARQRAPAQITRLLDTVLPPLRHLPDITISVHPFMLESLTATMTGIRDRYGGRVVFVADDTLPPADIRVDWPGGCVVRLDQDFQHRLRAALLPFHDGDEPSAHRGVDHVG